jgi:hypothetical protein
VVLSTRIGDERRQLEIDCLGSNTLEDLGAYIYCVNDVMGGPGVERESYFVIEGCVYVESDSLNGAEIAARCMKYGASTKIAEPEPEIDPKVGSSTDVGEPVKQRRPRKSKVNNTVEEASTPSVMSQLGARIDKLPIKIGKRYRFHHGSEGACEHHIFFSDVHLSHKSVDLVQRSKYPRLRFQSKMRRRLCGVCEISSAQVIVFGDRLCKDNPSLHCNHCYDLLHRTTEGELVYDDFFVFPYSHDIV